MAPDDEQMVRARAHQIWEEEGRPEGREQLHWERAVREIREIRDGQKPALYNEELVLQPARIVPS